MTEDPTGRPAGDPSGDAAGDAAALRQATLGCLLSCFTGPTPPAWLLRSLAEGLGGVVLFASNTGDGTGVRALTDRLREAAGRPVVVAVDEEGGEVTRLDAAAGGTTPTAAALGELDEPDTTTSLYRGLGARLVEAGITLDLAPVADVNRPANPVIGLRSFGSDPELVARHVTAAVTGLQGAGVNACAKHFPGHGDTVADSHVEVATVPGGRASLDAVDLVPFRAAIEAGVASVMTGHLLVPALDPAALVTVSRTVTTGLLRDELGFTGGIVTDALEMQALAGTVGIAEGFVGALAAGADTIETGAVEDPGMVEQIVSAVARAVGEGRLSAERVREAAAATAALARQPTGSTAHVASTAQNRSTELSRDREDAAASAATRAVRTAGVLPRLVNPLVIECHSPASAAAGRTGWSLGDLLAERVAGTRTVVVDDDAEVDLTGAGQRSVVLVIRDAGRHRWQQRLLAAVSAVPTVVVVDVGWPYNTGRLPTIRTRGTARVQLAAAVELLAAAR